MLMLRLWNYIRGYVIIVVEGYFLEKFINICIHRQIFLWDIKRQKNCVMHLKVSIRGFKKLRPIARKTGCRVNIIKKRGLPFVLNKYKGRKTFVIGALVFVLLLYVMSSFIWAVEVKVKGNSTIDTQRIVDRLASYGVRPGVLKFKINTGEVANKMMLENDELAWIGVSVKGTKVKVEVFERIKPPEIIPEDVPCDIIAARDGVIKTISAKAGQQAVNNGDTVKAGQVLISGTVESKNKDVKPKLVHAMGNVKARTWYEGKSPVNLIVREKQRTGKVRNKYSLVLFTKKIKLFFKDISDNGYEKVEVRKKLSFGENLVFPFELVVDKYYESNTVEKEIDLDEAKQTAANNAYKEAEEDIPEDAEIVSKVVNFEESEDGEMTAHVIIECNEEIGITKEIGGN